MRMSGALQRAANRFVLVALLVTAAAVAMLAAPAAARADATVAGVTTLADGRLVVTIYNDSPIWVQVTVTAANQDPTVLDQTDDLTAPGGGVSWVTSAPITGLTDPVTSDPEPHGSYPVAVDYRLADGAPHHWTGGVLDYRAHTGVVSGTYSNRSTDYEHRTVTASGHAETYDPVTDTTTPAAQASVELVWTGNTPATSGNKTVATDGNGDFSTDVTPGGTINDSYATIVTPPQGTVVNPLFGLGYVLAQSSDVRIAASPAGVRAHAGSTFQVSGTVQRLTDDGWQPLVGETINTTADYPLSNVLGSGPSDSSGHFSYLATAQATTGYRTSVLASDYLTMTDSAIGQLYVPTAGSITNLAFSMDEFRYATAHGRLHGVCGEQLLVLQYSKNGTSNWVKIHSLRTAPQYLNNPCAFKITGYGGVDGYYRVVHSESNQMLALTSARQRLHRIQTRVTPFAMSPTRPYRNAPLTGTGRVTQYTGGSWKALGSAHVVLVFRPKGSHTWYWVVKGYTNAKGYFSLKGKAFGDGSWGVYYDADAKHYYSQSKAIDVDVR